MADRYDAAITMVWAAANLLNEVGEPGGKMQHYAHMVRYALDQICNDFDLTKIDESAASDAKK